MMTLSLCRSPVPRQAPSLILAAALLGGLISGCRPAPKSDLQPGKAVVREIGGAEEHTYRLPLEDGTYLRMRIDQPGIDVTAKLVGPGGKEAAFFDEPKRLEEPDRLVWIAKTGRDYRLVIKPRSPRAARGAYRLSLQERRSARPDDSERLAAEAEYEQGRQILAEDLKTGPSQGLEKFQSALRRWKDVEDRIGEIDALVQISEIQNNHSNLGDALGSAQKALELAQEGHYPEGEARALCSIGNAYGRLAGVNEALGSFNRALAVWKDLGDPGWQGLTLYSLGLTLQKNSDIEGSVKCLAQARLLLHQAGNSGMESMALSAIGILQAHRGESREALDNAEQALKLGESAHDDAARAAALSLRGNVYNSRGELEQALHSLKAALSLNMALGDGYSEAYNRQALGSVLFNLGEPDSTLEEYGRALKLSREIGIKDLESRVLANTGYVYQNAKQAPAAAVKYYEQVLKLQENYPSGKALTLTNIGAAYRLLGKPGEGLAFLEKAFKIRQQINDSARQASTFLEIGSAYAALKDPRAEESFRQSLELSRRFGNTGFQAETLYRWALFDRSRGRLKDALQRIRKSLEIVESVRSQVVNDKLRTSFFASKRAYYELLVSLLAQLDEESKGAYRAEALEASERARARGLLDLLAEGNVHAEVPPDLQRRDVELRSRLSWLQEQIARKSSRDLEAQMDQVQDAMAQLEADIRKRDQHYAQVRYPIPLRAEQIRSLIDGRTALLHYFLGTDASFLFVVTQKGLELHRLPKAADIANQVARLRNLIQARGPRSLPRFQEASAALYSILLKPAASQLLGKSRILIAPDGPLYLLPFETLLTEKRGSSYEDLPYLLRRFAVSYIPSASVLADLRRPRAAGNSEKSFLAFADPSYEGTSVASERGGGDPSGGLAQLPASGEEVRRIASLFPGKSMLYLGPAATKQNVVENAYLRTTPRIHFALHGVINAVRPELSGLELADGRLQVFDIFNLKLSADLLTLSACETALGKEIRGEGMVGLTQAFLYAGARSIVVSLWPVADRSTSDLMYNTYRNLGAGKMEALRQAKLAMISSSRYAEPYYWAPFVLSGDPR